MHSVPAACGFVSCGLFFLPVFLYGPPLCKDSCKGRINTPVLRLPPKVILSRAAGIQQVFVGSIPLVQPPVVKQLEILVDDEGHDAVGKATKQCPMTR